MKALRTIDIARAAGVHPNTIRLYEELGFLPRPERGPNGYRLYTEVHRKQALLIRNLKHCTWLGGKIRRTALALLQATADGDTQAALPMARELLHLVQEERTRAEMALSSLEAWASAPRPDASGQAAMTIGEAAVYLGVTPDTLRNWDRNGLLTVPRHPGNHYRTYGPAELRLLMVIRTLRRARYSLMSIQWMLRHLSHDGVTDPRPLLDTVPPGEGDPLYNTDRWLHRVIEVEGQAREALRRVGQMAAEG